MPREKKERVAINARLSKDVIDKLEAYCDETGFTKTLVMEKAIDAYIGRQERNLVMSPNEMQNFIKAVGRTELYEELQDLSSDKYALVRKGGRPKSRYLKAVRATLCALGYDEQWVDDEVRSALEDRYPKPTK